MSGAAPIDTDKPQKKEKRPQEGRTWQEQIGPRTPRMVGTITRVRCSNCGAVLQAGVNPNVKCPRCGFDLHCCKQCAYFDTGARFECMQPVPERITRKDQRNDCSLFQWRMTVEKDTAPSATTAAPGGRPPTIPSTGRPTCCRRPSCWFVHAACGHPVFIRLLTTPQRKDGRHVDSRVNRKS